MTGRFPRFASVLALLLAVGTLRLFALEEPSAVTGTVRDGHGTPQIGALVELLRPDTSVVGSAFTDEHGRFALTHIVPGTYGLKATGTLFLPTLRENLQITAHTRTTINLTLSTLIEAFQWLPAKPRPSDEPDDDWAWTLRSAANRPLLRMLEDGPLVVVSDSNSAPALKARVTLHGGANEFGEGGLHHAFELERSKQDDRRVVLRADLGSSDTVSIASAQLLAGYEQELSHGRTIRTVAAFEDLPEIESTSSQSGLQAVLLRSAETLELTPSIEAEGGNEFEAVRMGTVQVANQPFANVTWRHGDNAVSYHIATARDAQRASELDQSVSADSRMTEMDGLLRMERGLHQEIEFEQTGERMRIAFAVYRDSIQHPVVNGGGSLSTADLNSGDVIYDPLIELMRVSGSNYSTTGVDANVKARLQGETWITWGFADGEALSIPAFSRPLSLDEGLRAITPRHTQMYSVGMNGRVAPTGTHWRASYRWQPGSAVTAVAPYDTNAPDAYLSLFLRQPLHCWHVLPSGMEALIDVRNLLAQGYRPFVTKDGSTLYFAQAERSIRGGLSFSF